MEYGLKTSQIAVIIATKNRPQLLKERSLSSISKQSRLPNHLIIVDDSSKQTQRQNELIVESLQSSVRNVRYLKNQRTSGASGAWNTAVDYLCRRHKIGSGSMFLAFLDDDDEWLPSYLERCLETANTNNCDMVVAGFYRYESNDQKPIACLPPKSLKEDLFLRGNPGIQGSNLFLSLKVMLMAGGFDEHLPSCTDRDFCIRLCELGTIRYQSINQPLLNHYADSDRQRLSTPHSQAKKEGLAAFWLKYYGRMNKVQSEVFLERSRNLFDWQPEVNCKKKSKPDLKIALTLGIELGYNSFSQLGDAIEKIHRVGQENLVGFNLVLSATQDINLFDFHVFLDLVGLHGITCYNLCALQICIETATALIAKENVGHSAWVLRDWKRQKHSSGQSDISISAILADLGANKLQNDRLNELYKTRQIELVQQIKQCRIDAAHTRINRLFDVSNLKLLGIGSEAIILTDGKQVFKCIDYWKTRTPVEQIKFLKQECSKWGDLPGLYALKEIVSDGRALVLSYPYEVSTPYQGGECEQLIELIHSCSKLGIVCNNVHPKNLIKTVSGVKLIDYGSDIRPWNELGFEHMARRAFLSIQHAKHPQLKYLMSKSLRTTNMPEMQGYQTFRQRLTGIDCNLKLAKQARMQLAQPKVLPTPFSLVIGVITGDAHKLLPLLNSIAQIAKYSFLSKVKTIVLCNGCSVGSLKAVLRYSKRIVGNVQIISEAHQVKDAKRGLFGSSLANRQYGQVSIAHARTMLQKYVGLDCERDPQRIAWILDDDMRVDARAKQYLEWLPSMKQEGFDVVIGQYEGASPNPPLNGLRGQLLDLLHNLRWLGTMSDNIELPDRSEDNAVLRSQYPDYYYDLSRKHSGHIEAPFWIEPAYQGETVGEARARLFTYAPLLTSGFPLTRGIIPECSTYPLSNAKNTVNRGGNTFVLNSKALTQTPNLTPKVNGREIRRSDMFWAIINKHFYGLSIKSAPFPVFHVGRINKGNAMDLMKVQDEIMGSALYAGLQEFLSTKEDHQLIFTHSEITKVWRATQIALDERLIRLKLSFYRINGLAKALSKFSELTDLCEFLKSSFNPSTFSKLETKVKRMNEYHVTDFLNRIVPRSTCFAKLSRESSKR